MNIIKVVLDKIEKLRIEKGLTVFKLTELSGLSENTIYNWYSKGSSPSIPALHSVCSVLGITMSQLFSVTDKELLNLQEEEPIKDFKQLTKNQKNIILNLISELNQKQE